MDLSPSYVSTNALGFQVASALGFQVASALGKPGVVAATHRQPEYLGTSPQGTEEATTQTLLGRESRRWKSSVPSSRSSPTSVQRKPTPHELNPHTVALRRH